MSVPGDVIVRLERVTKVYRHDSVAVQALDGIDLEIRAGDFGQDHAAQSGRRVGCADRGTHLD
jgi:hypothetical protein